MPSPYRMLLSALLAGWFTTASAAGPLQFENARSPEAPPVAPVMAGYVDITNNGEQAVTINAARCPEFNKVEIHDMQHKDGMMRMIRQDNLPIPAGQTVSLQPGGMHLMLMKPKRVIKAGETLQVTFELSDGSSQTVSFAVKANSMHNQQQHHHH